MELLRPRVIHCRRRSAVASARPECNPQARTEALSYLVTTSAFGPADTGPEPRPIFPPPPRAHFAGLCTPPALSKVPTQYSAKSVIDHGPKLCPSLALGTSYSYPPAPPARRSSTFSLRFQPFAPSVCFTLDPPIFARSYPVGSGTLTHSRTVLLLGPLHTGSRLGSLRPTLPALRGPRSSLRASRLFDLPARARTLSDSDASHATLHAPRLGPIFRSCTRLPLPLPHSCSDHGPFTLHATVPSSLTGLTRPAWTGLPGRVSLGLAHSLPRPAATPRPLHSGRLQARFLSRTAWTLGYACSHASRILACFVTSPPTGPASEAQLQTRMARTPPLRCLPCGPAPMPSS